MYELNDMFIRGSWSTYRGGKGKTAAAIILLPTTTTAREAYYGIARITIIATRAIVHNGVESDDSASVHQRQVVPGGHVGDYAVSTVRVSYWFLQVFRGDAVVVI